MSARQFKTLDDAYREALRLDNAGQYADARKLCQNILKQSGDHPAIHHLMGVIFLHEARLDDAIAHLKQALKLKPDLAEAAYHLSLVYKQKSRWRDWLGALETVHKLQPHRADIVCDMGYAHEMLKEPHAAIARYQQAVTLDPNYATAHSNAAAIHIRQGALADAEQHLNAALAIKPDAPLALINLGFLHEACDRRDEALATYDHLLRLQPDNVQAQYQRSLALIMQGRLAEGWAANTARFHRPDDRTLHNAFRLPYWRGEPLADRKLLVWTEQGPGDEILLGSMLPDVVARGAHLTLVCSPRLVPLFQRTFPDAAVVSHARLKTLEGQSFDFQASFSELGLYLRPDFTAYPERRGYLAADPVLTPKLRARYLNGGADKLVGIAWHSANATAEAQKSTTLADWGPLLALPGVRFVNLQYGPHRKDAKAVKDAAGRDIIADNTIDPLQDIDGFAAQVGAMDYVVSVSNTTAHVAGGLGIPTFTMLPAAFGRIWYWFLDRSDSPWYPSVRLYRQQTVGDWTTALADIARDLRRTLGITA